MQGLSLPALTSNDSIDQLSDEFHPTLVPTITNDIPIIAPTLPNGTPSQSSQSANAQDTENDLLSFDPYHNDSNNADTPSSNYLSFRSSPLYNQYWHQQQQHFTPLANNTWTPMSHTNNTINPTIVEL
jgi:hypothetical protein